MVKKVKVICLVAEAHCARETSFAEYQGAADDNYSCGYLDNPCYFTFFAIVAVVRFWI